MARAGRAAETTVAGRRVLLAALVAAVATPGSAFRPAARAAEPAQAIQFIDRLGKQVLDVLRDERLERSQRLDRLTGLLDQATDLALVARLVLGRYWRDASEPQRREYTALFRSLVLKTMADRLEIYGGETYEVLGGQRVDDRDTIVSTRIRRPGDASAIAVDWRVREQGGRLLIIDIVAEGVSMVVTQRSEAAEIAGRAGLDGLLEEMRRRLSRTA